MPIKPSTSFSDLIGRRFDSLGLQFAHIIGVKFGKGVSFTELVVKTFWAVLLDEWTAFLDLVEANDNHATLRSAA